MPNPLVAPPTGGRARVRHAENFSTPAGDSIGWKAVGSYYQQPIEMHNRPCVGGGDRTFPQEPIEKRNNEALPEIVGRRKMAVAARGWCLGELLR